jgi:hypothetical protein
MTHKEVLERLQNSKGFTVEFSPRGQDRDTGAIAMGIDLTVVNGEGVSKRIKTVGFGKSLKSAEKKALVEAATFIGL